MSEFTDLQLMEAAQRCANAYAQLCNATFVNCNIQIPVKIDYKLADVHPKWAGCAYGGDGIGLNMVMMRDYPSEFLNEVIPHEISHNVKHQVFDRNGVVDLTAHGAEWQLIMKKLGKVAAKYHKMDTTKAVQYHKNLKRMKRAKETEDVD